MHNKVVYRIARGLRRAGAVVLRFNYRGVNLSEGEYAHGEGELKTPAPRSPICAGAIPICRSRWRDSSFGSRIVLRLALCEGIRRPARDRRGVSDRLSETNRSGRLLGAAHLRAEHARPIRPYCGFGAAGRRR